MDLVLYMADHGLDTMNNWTLDVEINGKPAPRLDGNASSQ